MTTVWFDSLSWRVVALVAASPRKAIRLALLLGRHPRKSAVRYWRVSARMRRALPLLAWARRSGLPVPDIQQAPYLADMLEPDGTTLRLKIDAICTEWAHTVSAVVKSRLESSPLPDWCRSDRTVICAEKMASLDIYPFVALSCVIKWQDQRGSNRDSHVIVCRQPRCGNLLPGMWNQPPARILAYGRFIQWWQNRRATRRLPGTLRAVHQLVLAAKTDRVRHLPVRLAVQFWEGLRPPAEYFWFPESGIDADRIIVYHRGKLGQAHSDTLKNLDKTGFHWVRLSERTGQVLQGSTRLPLPFHLRPGGDEALKVPKLQRLDDELRWFIPWVVDEIAKWLHFCVAYNVKVHFYVDETSLVRFPQFIAAELIGAVQMTRQRSTIAWTPPGPWNSHPGHVLFVWGQEPPEWLEGERSGLQFSVVIGFWYDHAFEDAKQTGTSIRAKLNAAGARYIVGLYDQYFWTGGMYSPAVISAFYEPFLDWLENDPSLGLVIKSKKRQVLDDIPALKRRVARAEATGRCVRTDPVDIPAVAGYASDMVAGIGIGSAVQEALLTGVRGVHCDLGRFGSGRHYCYESGFGQVVFDDARELVDALRRHKTGEVTSNSVGNFSALLPKVDPFRDGCAGARAGTYIKRVVTSLQSGLDGEAALREANAWYSARWGAERVVTVGARATDRSDTNGASPGSAARELAAKC